MLEQTYPNWELFIMDDASNEETIQEITRFLGDERINYYNSGIENEDRHKTTRYATLINEAIPKTNGKYLSYLTDDTIYTPNRLRKMVAYLEKNREVQIIYSSQKIIKINEQNKILIEKIRKTKGILSNAANIVDHCSVMHTKKIAEKVKHHFGSYWPDSPQFWHNGDAAFWTRLSQFAKFYPLDEVLDISYKTPLSFQYLNAYLPKDIPEGILVKGYLPHIYLIENNQRRRIQDSLFDKLGYDLEQVVSIPDPYLYKFEAGPTIDEEVFQRSYLFPNGRLVTSNGDEFFYIQDHKKRRIENRTSFDYYNFSFKDIVKLEKEFLEQFEEGPSLIGPIFQVDTLPNTVLFFDGNYYYVSQHNQLYEIDIPVLEKLKLKKEKAVFISAEEKLRFFKGEAYDWDYYNKKKKRKQKAYNAFTKSKRRP